MKIEVKQEKLAKGLGITSKVAGGIRASLPILNNVLIKTENKKVDLITTNLEIAIKSDLSVSEAADGSVAVPARLLSEFVNNLPKGENVVIESKDKGVEISAGKYKSIINSANVLDFPELPEIDEKKAVIFKMSVEDFKKNISLVMVASSLDTNRPVLTGVYFNTFEGDLYIAATDGYRMAEMKFVEGVKSELAAVVPTVSLQEVIRSFSEDTNEIEIMFNEDQVKFKFGGVEIISKLIDGSYPNYRQLIPKEIKNGGLVSRDELNRVVKLASLFAKNTRGAIVCESIKDEGIVRVSSVDNEVGSNSSDINGEIIDNGRAILNAKFITDVLSLINDEKVNFGLPKTGEKTPVLITGEKLKYYRYIVMPIEG